MVKILTKDEMEGLSTRRLLAYRKRLLTCDETLWYRSVEWKELYRVLKDILSKREQIQ